MTRWIISMACNSPCLDLPLKRRDPIKAFCFGCSEVFPPPAALNIFCVSSKQAANRNHTSSHHVLWNIILISWWVERSGHSSFSSSSSSSSQSSTSSTAFYKLVMICQNTKFYKFICFVTLSHVEGFCIRAPHWWEGVFGVELGQGFTLLRGTELIFDSLGYPLG